MFVRTVTHTETYMYAQVILHCVSIESLLFIIFVITFLTVNEFKSYLSDTQLRKCGTN